MPAGMPDPSRMSAQERMMYDQYMNASPEEQRRMEQQTNEGRGGGGGRGSGPDGMFLFTFSSDVLVVLYLSKVIISELCF
jgi:hypothetical protein